MPVTRFCHLSVQEHPREGHFVFWREIHKLALQDSGELYVFRFNVDLELSILELKTFCKVNSIDFVFLEWFHDLSADLVLKIDTALSEVGIKWLAQADVSTYLRDSLHDYSKSVSLNVLSHVKMCKSLIMLITWDTHIVNRFNFLDQIRLYGIKDFQETGNRTLVNVASMKSTCDPTVGLVGQLYDYRGAKRLIEWSKMNPRLHFKLAGQAKDTAKDLCKGRGHFQKRNLEIQDHFFETEEEINHAISSLDYLFLDTQYYPGPSGIALRARDQGIPLIITGGDSFYLDEASRDSGILILPSEVLKNPSLFEPWVNGLKHENFPGQFKSPDRVSTVENYMNIFRAI
jgi:hypothetical protein